MLLPAGGEAVAQTDQDESSTAQAAAARQIEVVQIAGGAPEIDGELNEPAWQNASWVTEFTQSEPVEGAPATLDTRVAFLYDEQALYVGARMQSDDRAQINDLLTRRDESGNAERLIVSLDTYHDRRTAYSFAITAAGVRVDYFHPEDTGFFPRDFTWDPVWEAETEIDSTGWTAEMRIPFSQLRFNDGEEQVWGVNLNRYVPSINEDAFWIIVPRDETGWASRFGELVGIEGIAPSRRIEVVPYVSSSARLLSDDLFEGDDPFAEQEELTTRAGVNLQIGLGPNLTLDATVNPDFGQVEADPAVVNLTAFEFIFEERRPFFTKGQENFDGFGFDYYYSRRIGAAPHGRVGGDFQDVPTTTTILGAAKLTGHLRPGLTVGALGAVTDDERGRSYDFETDRFQELVVEPATGYGVVRLQQQFGQDGSTVGATLTGVKRALEDGSDLAGLIPESAITGGIDLNRRFADGAYELMAHAGFSHLSGDTTAIARLQRSSVHFFQRPDADHVDLDPGRESLGGWVAGLGGGKRSGSWRWGHEIDIVSPGFDLNDVGQLRSADEIEAGFDFGYVESDPGDFFRQWSLFGFGENGWNFGGTRVGSFVGLTAEYTLLNYLNGFVEGNVQISAQSDDLTRGGPLMETLGGGAFAIGLFTNRNDPNQIGFRSGISAGDEGGWWWRVDPEARFQATDRLSLSFEPRYIRERNPRQFITTIDDGRAETFGQRYVFSYLDYSEIAAPVRVNYVFSPELSLELYAEPFAASGRFFDFGELAAPRTSDLVTYGVEGGTTIVERGDGGYSVTDGDQQFNLPDLDFDALSFRSNLVLRWEWRAGSTLFVVWQQNRAEDEETGRLVDPEDLLDSLASSGENVLAVKFTYWLPL